MTKCCFDPTPLLITTVCVYTRTYQYPAFVTAKASQQNNVYTFVRDGLCSGKTLVAFFPVAAVLHTCNLVSRLVASIQTPPGASHEQ